VVVATARNLTSPTMSSMSCVPHTFSVAHSKPYREPDPVTDSVAHNKPYREPVIDTRKPQSRLTLGVCPHRITRGFGVCTLFCLFSRSGRCMQDVMNLTDPNNSVMGHPVGTSACPALASSYSVLTYVGVRITEWRGAEPTSGLGANLNLNLN
jgi:hypothetical protein